MSGYKRMEQPAVDAIDELASFLRKHGSQIQTKTSKFSLSSAYVVYLNKCFCHLTQNQASSSKSAAPQTKREEDVAYLLDFCQKAHAIKVVHGTMTLQGAIDIGHFRALTFLEIKRVPVHLLVGLKALRRQLEVLICSRSLTSISALLQSCGGEMASSAPWPALHTVNLSHNHIDKLDDSLKLLPSVKVLDLSHNDIKHTRNYLEDMSEIAHLNLSFNKLETMPALGLVARTNLKSLSLKNNNLESLAGLEDFSSLEVLDGARNCIFDQMELRMLGYLHNIKAVYLHGNPIAFDPNYRLQVVKKLPYQACRNKTTIDSIPLTSLEAKLVSPERFTPSPVPRRPPYNEPINPLEASLTADVSSLEESMDFSSTKRLMHKEKKSRGKRNQRKVKHAAIADPAKAHLDSNTSLTTSDSDIEGTKQKVERMRKNHGSDWLLALQDPYSTPPVATTEPNQFDSSEPSRDPSISEIEQLTEVEVHQSDDIQEQSINTEQPTVAKEMVVITRVEKPEDDTEVTSEAPAVKTIDSKTNIYPVKSTESDYPSIYEEQQDRTIDEAQELLGPLLVTVYQTNDSTEVQLFVTVRTTYIEEKDTQGQVAEELDLVSLKGMKKTQDTLRDPDSQFVIVPVIELTFDYIRRDRQKRRYFMENEESCLMLFNVLEPFVEKNQLEERRKGMVQCLKCSIEFHKHEAKRKVSKTSRKTVIQNAMGSTENSSSDDMNEVLVCPECNSSMVVGLEHPQQSKGLLNSNASTPYGSVSSLDMNPKPPVATSSPWKPLENDVTVSSPSTEYQSAEGSPSNSPGQQASYQTAKSGTSTINGDSQATASTDRTLQLSVTNSEQSVSPMKRSLLGEFNLPEATMRMSIGESAGEEISPYPPEKMAQMLYTGVKGFDQKYSLVPPVILSGNSSREASKPSTPVSKTNGHKRTVDSDEDHQQSNNGVASNERLLSGNPPQFPVHSTVDQKLNVRTRKPSGTGSEDDIEVLERQSVHQNEIQHGGVSDDSQRNWLHTRTLGIKGSRLGSNDSDIAVIGDHLTDDVKSNSTTSDTVFDAGQDNMQSNLASALSDVASRLQPLSPVAELNANVSSADSSGSDNDVHIHAKFSQNTAGDIDGRLPNEQHKSGDSSVEHSSTESQLSDNIYTRSARRRSSHLESVNVDFSQVDHRLKLHFDMELFSADEEEFKCMIKANIYQLSKSVDFNGYLLVSSHNLYILKITKEESDNPSDWLNKRTQHPIRDLLYIHIGLGSQSFQLEFNNDGVLYTVAVRDKQWCEKFISQFTDVLHNSPINKRKYQGIIRDHPNTQANLMCQVYGALLSENSPADVDTDLTLYILGYRKVVKELKKSVSLQLEPIGIVATGSDIYLTEENHYWSLQQTKVSRGSSKHGSKQFTHSEQHAIIDIAGLELYEDALCDVTINFHSEDTGEESQWHLQTETTSTLAAFMSAIQVPWQQLFGVAMPLITHPTITILDEF